MLYLLALVLPPVAVLCTGRIGAFFLNCLLTLCFHVPGAIHAVLVVHDYKEEQRTERIIQALRS